MPFITVDPADLARIAEAVRATRDEYLTITGPLLDQLATAAAAVAGWAIGDALTTLESWWQRDIATFAGHLATTADRLDQAASAYRAADQAGRNRFQPTSFKLDGLTPNGLTPDALRPDLFGGAR